MLFRKWLLLQERIDLRRRNLRRWIEFSVDSTFEVREVIFSVRDVLTCLWCRNRLESPNKSAFRIKSRRQGRQG